MDFLKSWILNIAIISIIISIITSLVPTGNLEKIVKFAASGLLLLCFITPFFTNYNIDFSNAFKIDETKKQIYEMDFDKTSLSYSKIECENLIRKKLSENNISTNKIDVVITKKDEKLIISRINIKVSDTEKTKNILIDELLINKDVIFIDGDE
ncbi:MAG: stage III sporulation protein AF [Clostridia bacterium]